MYKFTIEENYSKPQKDGNDRVKEENGKNHSLISAIFLHVLTIQTGLAMPPSWHLWIVHTLNFSSCLMGQWFFLKSCDNTGTEYIFSIDMH